MSVSFKSLSNSIASRYEELKACGANKPGGGGFSTGNTCARGGGGDGGEGGVESEETQTISKMVKLAGSFGYAKPDTPPKLGEERNRLVHPNGNSITIKPGGTLSLELRMGVKPKSWVGYYINVPGKTPRSGKTVTALNRDLKELHPKEKS